MQDTSSQAPYSDLLRGKAGEWQMESPFPPLKGQPLFGSVNAGQAQCCQSLVLPES